MKEKELINIIKTTLNSEYIGDDCAFLKDLDIVISQDSLVEDVHFELDTITPYQLGWKSAMVNISDICASGAKPEYMTVALSIPEYIDEKFVEEFYMGIKEACEDIKVVGGDVTSSNKLYISIAIIGSTTGRKISSRSYAKAGFKIIVSGEHGNSSMGLALLKSDFKWNKRKKFVDAHLMPVAQRQFSKEISENIDCDYAMMDTSDGLADALMQIAKASNVTMQVYSSKIPHDNFVDINRILYGGEDYQLVACVPENILDYMSNYTIIGEVKNGKAGIMLDENFIDNIDDKVFNHFEK